MPQPIFRFAPSPNGHLHLGHALSALLNAQLAKAFGGVLLLRFDDNDKARSRAEYEAQILDDLDWLGLSFTGAPLRLRDAHAEIADARQRLQQNGLVYPACLSRAQVKAIAQAHAQKTGQPWPCDPDGALLYPGRSHEGQNQGPAGERLDLNAALAHCETDGVSWQEFDEKGALRTKTRSINAWGDVLLCSKSGDDAYAFATVVHDALIGITHVVRGLDLQENTCVQRFLQELLGLPAPVYHHHRLVLDKKARKLSKSEGALSLKALRAGGASRSDILAMLGL